MNYLKRIASVAVFAAAFTGLLSAPALAASNSTLKLGYVQSWPSSSITTKIAAKVLEDDLNQPVKLLALSAGPMYQGVSSGDLDAMLTAWLPKTHASYYKKTWSKVVNLGPNLTGTRLGVAVPKYVKANSISDLKGEGGKFDNRIVGVGSGAGVNENTKKAIKEYNLSDFKLTPSSTAAMAASLKRAIRQKKPIAVTGWAPLWIWSAFDLKFLKDPKNVYGRAGYISTLANPQMVKKMPKAFAFLSEFRLKLSDVNGIEAAMQKKGQSEDEAIKDWMNNHQDEIKRWTSNVKAS